jgi:hypothetical protein
MDKKLFPTCLAVVLCCLFTLPLFSAPVSSDECNAPAPGNFRKTAEGPGYVTLGWEPVESGASHLLTVSEVLADGSETLVYTFDGISAVTKKVDGLKQRTRYKFKIYTKCADGNPSLIPSEVDIITLIIELTLAGRKPVNPQPVGCSGIEYNNPENEWVGFRIYRFDEGKIIENLFEFEYLSEINTSKIMRVEEESVLVAANEVGAWPTGQNSVVMTLNPFRVAEIVEVSGIPSVDEFGAIRIKLTTGFEPTLELCIDPSIGWDGIYFYEPMVAASVEGGSVPTGGGPKYNLIRSNNSSQITVHNPFNETLDIHLNKTVRSGTSIFYLFGSQGELIFERKLNCDEELFTINTANLPKGIYFAKILIGSEQFSYKLLKI